MAPILGIWASQNYSRYSITGSYESIATVTVGSGGSSYIEFTSIPATYSHLQIRIISASVFGTTVVDILDYANTNKYKTFRSLMGIDNNGSGSIRLRSGLWMSTSAITAIKMTPSTSGSFQQYSSFALYGIASA
ncbi:MAG: hypothetical protein EBY66_05360 [Candidatus Fonsibacter lacus]|nr:hypothetical protein [Candidatus Fonsibacter lacus]